MPVSTSVGLGWVRRDRDRTSAVETEKSHERFTRTYSPAQSSASGASYRFADKVIETCREQRRRNPRTGEIRTANAGFVIGTYKSLLTLLFADLSVILVCRH